MSSTISPKLKKIRVMLIEDSKEYTILIVRELESNGFDVSFLQVNTEQAMRDALDDDWDIILSDYNMPKFSAIAALDVLKKGGKDFPFDENLLIEVEDTGIGIVPDMKDKILEPFTQVDQSSTRKYRGTGLGLTIVSKILENLKSSLNIKSEPGKGTTISNASRKQRMYFRKMPNAIRMRDLTLLSANHTTRENS